jgi:hypothetical protein
MFRRCDNETATNATTPAAPTCDLSNIQQPASTLKAPTPDMQLVLVAFGEGTQNYTCGANLTAPPTAIGAVAQLFDASCEVANDPLAHTFSSTTRLLTSISSAWVIRRRRKLRIALRLNRLLM